MTKTSTLVIFAIFLVAGALPLSGDPVESFEKNFLSRYQKASVSDRIPLLASFIKDQQAGDGFPIRSSDGKVISTKP